MQQNDDAEMAKGECFLAVHFLFHLIFKSSERKKTIEKKITCDIWAVDEMQVLN